MAFLRKVLDEPLVHFAVLGTALFVAYAALHPSAGAASGEIVVDSARVDSLARDFERTWQRPATTQELRGLVDTWVRDEMLYREGQAAGLDRDDMVVRRRVVQKMTMLAEEMHGDVVDEAEVRRWFDDHRAAYRRPASYSFRQVYIDPRRHGDRLAEVARVALASLGAGGDTDALDPTLLPARLDDATAAQVAGIFGTRFAGAVRALPIGQWHGPIASAYGAHLVLVTARDDGQVPPFDDVRQAVLDDVLKARADRALAGFLEDARRRYSVRVSGPIEARSSPTSAAPGERPAPPPDAATRAVSGLVRDE